MSAIVLAQPPQQRQMVPGHSRPAQTRIVLADVQVVRPVRAQVGLRSVELAVPHLYLLIVTSSLSLTRSHSLEGEVDIFGFGSGSARPALFLRAWRVDRHTREILVW